MMRGDVETALSTLHPELVVHEPDSLWYPGDWHGPQGFSDIIGLMTSKLDLEIKSYETFDSPQATVMRAEVTFTSKATGRSVDLSVVEVYKARDGRIIDMDIYYKDTAAVIALAEESRS